MTVAFIAGATGLIGQHLLNNLLDDPRYQEVCVLVRQTLPIQHDKLVQIVDPMTQLETVQHRVQGHDVFCCLGTTQKKAGTRQAFRQVDYELPMALARGAKAHGSQHFLVVSAMGASARSPSFYSRTKGELELDLKSLGLPNLAILRPSLLLGKRSEKRLAEEIGQTVSRWLNPILPRHYRAIPAADVALALQAIARQPAKVKVYESGDLSVLARRQETLNCR